MPYISKRRISPPNNHKEVSAKRNHTWNKYYQNKKYKNLRDYYMSLHPLCIDCLFEGRSVPATELHHIRPISTGANEEERMQLLLNPDNFAPLCSYHHDLRHAQLKHNHD